MTKTRSTLSWSVSIIVHSLLAIVIARYSYKMAFPEATVVETVSIETYEDKAAPSSPEVPSKTTPEVTKVAATKPIPVISKTKSTKPVFLPDKPANNVAPMDKTPEVETQEESPVVIPPAPETQQVESAPQEEAPKATPEEVVQEVAPPAPEAAPATPTNEAAESSEPRPAFGTPGSMIDESKLVGRPGNRKPSYPWMARLRRNQGTVEVKAFVKKDGTLDSISLFKSSGFPLLDQAAVEAFSTWKYMPRSPGWTTKPFTFILKDSK